MKIVVEAPDGLPPVPGDRDRVLQLIMALAENSFNYSEPDQAICLRACLAGGSLQIEVTDTGVGIAPEHLHSVITFVGGSTFKTEMPANVTEGAGFIRYIKSFRQPVFSEAEVDALLRALQEGRRAPTLATHREHVQNLKRRSDPTAERQCPKCGSLLVLRTVKSGAKAGQQFWGCSTFPKCRIMQSL